MKDFEKYLDKIKEQLDCNASDDYTNKTSF
jgi:hypothetical protein